MMMALGMFVFGLPTLAYQQLQRDTTWRHAANSRVGARPGYQFVGAGEDIITLTGWISPELTGTGASVDVLRNMADTGNAYVLVAGTGNVLGAWTITSVSEGQSLFHVNGVPRRVEFTVMLTRVDNDTARTLLGELVLPAGALP